LNDKADASDNYERHNGAVDQQVSLISHQAVREEGVAAIVECGDGMIGCLINGLARRKVLTKTHPKQDHSQKLKKQREDDDGVDQREEVPLWSVKKTGLENVPLFDRYPSAYENKKESGKSDDAKTTDLKKE
jgi:hypothetical protein